MGKCAAAILPEIEVAAKGSVAATSPDREQGAGDVALHRFSPTHYHIAIGAHAPVLRLAPGDTIETTMVDAAGCDASGRQVTPRGNPQTGPFYVDGAEPGDTLTVRLERLTPNRRQGWSGSTVAANVVDPEYVATLPARQRLEWEVDPTRQSATLLGHATALGPLTLPLAPMLGCFGVAPGRDQAISTATSGPHGGNMDYRGFGPGVTAHFPVFVPGALLHIGDGHALQGDGEIVGTGVEISMDVVLTVGLLKGQRSRWPRGENAASIFTVGNARPLDQATQHATTEMIRWLQEGYRLETTTLHALLGQCVAYDIGNFFDPAYTVVCRLAKTALARATAANTPSGNTPTAGSC